MPSRPADRALWAYVAPFALFLVFLVVPDGVKKLGLAPSIWTTAPEQWVYPLQTVACAGVLVWFWKLYPWRVTAGGLIFGAVTGVAVFALWISPQWLFEAAPRTAGGFDPEVLRGTGWYGAAVGARFVRLAIVVPLAEEIFWRGFVLRYLVREDFTEVPLGTFTALSFWGVAVGFMLEHSRADWPAAFVTGVLYNLVAIRTRSLPACVLAHAVTNLLLGVYIMQTRQWGFW